MDVKEEIKKFLKGDIDDAPATIEKYSRDASLFYIKPKLVVYPKDTEDVQALVSFVSKAVDAGEKISLTARSAGTDMTGGPLTTSVVVDFTRYFNRILEVGEDYAVVEPGVYFRDFDKETVKKGLILPSYPASREFCTVGGMVSNNSGGEKTLKYGKTENYVEELNMVLADGKEYVFKKISTSELSGKTSENNFEGEVYLKISKLINDNYDLLKSAKPQVSKNSAGYYLWNVMNKDTGIFDMNKLLVGSQGTLGFITKIKFRLIKPKPASRLLVIFMNNLDPLGELTKVILRYGPESFESYDDNTFRLAIKFLPEMIERVKGNILKIGLSFIPELWLFLRGGMPKLVLLAEFTGDTAKEADDKARLAALESKRDFPALNMRVTVSDEETEEFWLIRRESFSLLRNHIKGLRTAPFIDDFSVKPESLPQFLPELNAILKNYKILYTVAGHVGDGNFHIIPLMDFKDPKTKGIISELSKKVYALVLKYRGSITGEHNDGLIRSPFLKEQFGEEVYKCFIETKKIFDPKNIFNPGKKVNAEFDYALSNLDIANKH